MLGADVPVFARLEAMDVQDNELDELDCQPLHVSGSGVIGEKVLDPSPSDGVLGSGIALRTSSRSWSRSGDERPPLNPDSHRSSRRRASSPSPARRV